MPGHKADLRRFYRDVAARAESRCEYCHAPESFFSHRHSVDHVVPESRGGLTSLENLALCCYACQQSKCAFQTGRDPVNQRELLLFNPRRQRWSSHFRWSRDGVRIEGLTAIGRATIARLDFNSQRQIEARRRWKQHPDLFP